MPQIILKERTANVLSYTFFTRDVDQYQNTSLSQLYQPPRTAFSKDTYHWLLPSCEYCKVFKIGLFYRTPPEAVDCRYSSKQSNAFILKSFANFTRKHLCWSLKTCRLKACNFIKKESNTGFAVKLAKFLRTPFLTEHLR